MMIPQKPRLKECFHAEVLPSDRVAIFNEIERYYLLTGPLYSQVVSLLYPTPHSTDEIVECLEKRFSAAEVYYVLAELNNKGLITEEKQQLSKSVASFCYLLDVSADVAFSRLNRTGITIDTVGDISAKGLKERLKELSLQIGDKRDLTVVVTDHYRREELGEFGRLSLRSKKPWLLLKAQGPELWVGPLFIPGKTGCFTCFLDRIKMNHAEERYLEGHRENPALIATNFASLPMTKNLAYDLAANEIFKWVVRGVNEELEGKVISYHQVSSKQQTHQLVKRPQCSSCGEKLPTQFSEPFVLESQKLKFFSDGGYRVVSPEETYEKYRHHISSITGIVQDLIDMSPANSQMYTYFAKHSSKKTIFQEFLLHRLRSTAAGKGKTRAQSKASCLCEALERYSGGLWGDEVKIKSSYQSLQDKAIHPSSYLLYSDYQYENRDTLNKTADRFQFIGTRFDETKEIEWTPNWSLTNQCWKYLPTVFCYYGYLSDVDHVFCRGNSNGCASGNTKEEAILQGFLELIERDAVAIWWYNRLRVPGVDLSKFKDPYVANFLSVYQEEGREVWVLDLTMDIAIPTFCAMSRKVGSKSETIIFGFGTHLDPEIALSRALTEMNQANANSHFELEKMEEESKLEADWFRTATVEKHPYVLPHPGKVSKNYTRPKGEHLEDLKEAVLFCQKLVEDKGLEMLVLDQTRPDIGLSVVRVTVPGLRHFWSRYAPGRLYDVPVELGYIDKKLKEEELNPIPMFV